MCACVHDRESMFCVLEGGREEDGDMGKMDQIAYIKFCMQEIILFLKVPAAEPQKEICSSPPQPGKMNGGENADDLNTDVASLSSIPMNDMLIKSKQWDRLPAPVTLGGCRQCQAVIPGLHLETCTLIRSALCRQCRQVLPRLGHAPFPSPATLLSWPP